MASQAATEPRFESFRGALIVFEINHSRGALRARYWSPGAQPCELAGDHRRGREISPPPMIGKLLGRARGFNDGIDMRVSRWILMRELGVVVPIGLAWLALRLWSKRNSSMRALFVGVGGRGIGDERIAFDSASSQLACFGV